MHFAAAVFVGCSVCLILDECTCIYMYITCMYYVQYIICLCLQCTCIWHLFLSNLYTRVCMCVCVCVCGFGVSA